MVCEAKRQNVGGALMTMSDWKCPSCNMDITIGRKGVRPSEDISRDTQEGA
jgi:hypothetical protein